MQSCDRIISGTLPSPNRVSPIIYCSLQVRRECGTVSMLLVIGDFYPICLTAQVFIEPTFRDLAVAYLWLSSALCQAFKRKSITDCVIRANANWWCMALAWLVESTLAHATTENGWTHLNHLLSKFVWIYPYIWLSKQTLCREASANVKKLNNPRINFLRGDVRQADKNR